MNDIIKIFLSLSLSGSLLVLLLVFSKPLYKNHISRKWQYYIWLVVIVRLLLPLAPEINLMTTLFQAIDHAVLQMDSPLPSQQHILPEAALPESDLLMEQHQSFVNNQQKTETLPFYYKIPALLVENLWLLWLMVALILLIRKITIYQSFVRYMKAGGSEICNIEKLEQFGKIVAQLEVKGSVSLYTNSLISSPLLIGFFRPSIILPSGFRLSVHRIT